VLRDLVRYRRRLVGSRTAERNRLLKLLETANIKLSSVVCDVFGVSGKLMLRALLEGRSKPEDMAQLARGRMRRKIGDLELALDGRLDEHHRFLLALQLRRLETLEADIAQVDARIDEQLEPYRDKQALLAQIPGVDRVLAATLIAELGVDMSVFHGPRALAAWAGVCPGNNESAGRRLGSRRRRGNVYLTTALVEAALGASLTHGSYLRDKFFRLKARRGHNRAAMAIAHKILIATYHVLSTGADYKDLGDGYLDHLDKTKVASQLVRRLNRLGYQVTLTENDTAA
jgi:transposase